MKRFILPLLLLLLLAPAAHGEVYTYDETEPIMNGVELRRLRRFYGDSWLNVVCVRADLGAEHVGLDLLKNGADKLTSIDGFTKTREGVLAAVNADFFDATYPSTAQGFSLGIEIKDGELLQSQIDENMAAAFYDGAALSLGYMSMSMSVAAPNGESCAIKHLNKHVTYYGDPVMYTSEWNGGLSPAPGGEVAEIVVENGAVTEFRRGLPPVEIPENGYVIDVSEGVSMFFANNFAVGDKIELKISATPDISNVKTAFGGGTMLLRDGKKTPYTHNAAGRSNRSCVGTNADGTVVYLIAVDGRQHLSRGATQDELADIALELGCVNAMNLDGGGSTRMMAAPFWDASLEVVNSPTENRRVINAVSVVTDAVPGPAVGVRLRSASDAVALGDSIDLEARCFDAAGLPAEAANGINWHVSGVDGKVENGVFTPYTAGTAEITADCGGEISEPLVLTVIGGFTGISAPEAISLAVGESYTPLPEVSGADGAYAVVRNLGLLSPKLEGGAARLEGGVITAVSEGYSTLRLSLNGATASMMITVGSPTAPPPYVEENISLDPARGRMEGDSFGVFAWTGEPVTLMDTFLYREGLLGISSSTSYGFLGTYRSELLPTGIRTPIAADKFSAIDKGFALVISLPASGSLSGGEWTAMANALATTSAQNVIVLAKTAPNGQSDADTAVFYDYFDFIAKTKNVFIVQPGARNASSRRGGLRFITLADSSLGEGIMPAAENACLLRFTMSGGECKFDFERLFDFGGGF